MDDAKNISYAIAYSSLFQNIISKKSLESSPLLVIVDFKLSRGVRASSYRQKKTRDFW